MHDKPVIGLSGGIGSGKSAVAKVFADLGCVVADSDAVARAALDNPEIRKRIVDTFGNAVLYGDANRADATAIDRSALAAIVFHDPAKRRSLEAIMHPWIEQRRLEQFAKAPADAPAMVIDAPLLFEAGLDRSCDAVIFVDAPREVRLERVTRTRGWDEAELSRREASQMPLDEKRRRADYVLVNSGSMAELAEQVRRILTTIGRARRTS